jgi:hypothetical protein
MIRTLLFIIVIVAFGRFIARLAMEHGGATTRAVV